MRGIIKICVIVPKQVCFVILCTVEPSCMGAKTESTFVYTH